MAAACVLLAWSAGPARAAGALDGVAAAAPAVTAQATVPAAATVQHATTSVRRADEPVRTVARPAVAPVRTVARPAVAPVERAVTTEAPAPAVHDAVRETPKSVPPRAHAAVARASTQRDADRREQRSKRRAVGGLAGPGTAAPIPPTTALPQPVLLAAAEKPSVTAAAGWRNRTAGIDRPQGDDGTAPVSPTGGATSVAAASSAAASAAGLLGVLLLLTFAAQRLGSLIRLRPDWASSTPFLALPERPG